MMVGEERLELLVRELCFFRGTKKRKYRAKLENRNSVLE